MSVINKTGLIKISIFCAHFWFCSVWAQQDSVQIHLTPTENQATNRMSSTDLTKLSSFVDSSRVVDYSLAEILELAIKHNRSLKRYRMHEQSAKIRLEQAEYRFLPSAYISGARNEATTVSLGQAEKTVKFSSNLGFFRELETGGDIRIGLNTSSSESSVNTGIINYNSGLRISVRQPLLSGRGIRVNTVPIERAKNYAKVSLLHVKQNLINLLTNIESRYWDLILVYEDYEIQKQALERAKQLLEVNKSLIESGRMAAQEIVQTESDIASREIAVAGAENSIIDTQIALQERLDLGGRILIRPTTKMEFDPVHLSLDDCLERAYQNRPDWKIHNFYLDIERMNLLVARNRNMYTLGSSASLGSDVLSNKDLATSLKDAMLFKELSWNVGLSFNFPFNKKVLQNYYELENLSLQRQEIYMQELRDDIRIDVEDAVRDVQFTLKQVSLAQRARQLARQKLTLEEDKMKVGRSSNFQVISYQRDLTNAQNKELRVIADYLKALGRLEQAMGTTLDKWGIQVTMD